MKSIHQTVDGKCQDISLNMPVHISQFIIRDYYKNTPQRTRLMVEACVRNKIIY